MESENIIEAYITSTMTIKNYTAYEITIVTNIKNLNNHYSITKRYSDFYKMHCIIKNEIFELPIFPKKVFNKIKNEIIQERACKLNFYIKYLCMLITKI